MDYSIKKEPIYTILAYEADKLQKASRSLRTDANGREVWEQNPLSIVPNVLALAAMMVNAGCMSAMANANQFEKHFQLDMKPYGRRVPRSGGTTMMSRAQVTREATDLANVAIELPEAKDLPTIGYAPHVPGNPDALTLAYENKAWDGAKQVDTGIGRRGIDVVLVNLLYNMDFPDALRLHNARTHRSITLDRLKDAHFVLLTPADVTKPDCWKPIMDNYTTTEFVAYKPITCQQAPVERKTPTPGFLANITGQFKAVDLSDPRDTKMMRKEYARQDVAFNVADTIYAYLVELHRQHPMTLHQYEEQRKAQRAKDLNRQRFED